MGDFTTHVIFYSGYWSLVYEDKYEASLWIDTTHGHIVCRQGEEEKLLELEDI